MRRHRAVFGVGDEAGFDEARFVITNAYTGGSDALKKSLETAPRHRGERYNAFCARELDYERRRFSANRPDRSCGCASLSVERGPAWLVAGAACDRCGPRVAAAGAARCPLDG
jgi:hypothetical protein